MNDLQKYTKYMNTLTGQTGIVKKFNPFVPQCTPSVQFTKAQLASHHL